jgi:hypothetical protein
MQVSLTGILMCALAFAARGSHHNNAYVYACVHLIMCAYVCSCAWTVERSYSSSRSETPRREPGRIKAEADGLRPLSPLSARSPSTRVSKVFLLLFFPCSAYLFVYTQHSKAKAQTCEVKHPKPLRSKSENFVHGRIDTNHNSHLPPIS